MRPRICLNMIVKDESAIIERCLRAAAPHIDCAVILDTGSTDRTAQIIWQTLYKLGVPFDLKGWHFDNFGQARNDALDAARNSKYSFDYVLLCDADMEFCAEKGALDALTAPAYYVEQRHGSLSYQNLRLVRGDLLHQVQYVGATHEYLDLGDHKAEMLHSVHFLDHADGGSKGDKFERDIGLLLKAPPTPRNLFYLAQSYRDSDHRTEALEAYRWRVDAGGWEEEVWYSLYQIARLTWEPQDFLAAYNYRPSRAETLVALAALHRGRQEWALAHLYASVAVQIPLPDDRLFVEPDAYGWLAIDECATAAYYIGRYAQARWLWDEILKDMNPPGDNASRIANNLALVEQRLNAQ